jgi:hypothetical protein
VDLGIVIFLLQCLPPLCLGHEHSRKQIKPCLFLLLDIALFLSHPSLYLLSSLLIATAKFSSPFLKNTHPAKAPAFCGTMCQALSSLQRSRGKRTEHALQLA